MVDGLANFWRETIAADGTRTQLEAGISPIGMVRAIDGRRTPAILLRSSPHKAGSEVTPWQDLFDPDHGHIRYYGDSKPTSQVLKGAQRRCCICCEELLAGRLSP